MRCHSTLMGFLKIPNVFSTQKYRLFILHGEDMEYGYPVKVLFLVWVVSERQEGLGWDITSQF